MTEFIIHNVKEIKVRKVIYLKETNTFTMRISIIDNKDNRHDITLFSENKGNFIINL